MKTKLFTFFLALGASAGTIFASYTPVNGIYYDFNSSTKTAAVTYRGSSYNSYSNEYSGSVTIPSTVTYNSVTYSVTSIGESAFNVCTGLTSVTIGNSVTSIGERAFYGCTGLTSVTIGNSVTSIGGEAFRGCSSLTSVTIPNSVTSIGDYAFFGCSRLTSIEIPNSVTSIGSWAFEDCSRLTSVTIPNSVKSISNNTFKNCSSLTSVTIPNSVKSIGERAFENCSSLTAVTIPNSVISIGYEAFARCSGLTSISIPNSITSIEEYAFSECSSLTSITIPNSVERIGQNAFLNSGVKTLIIGSGVKSIGSNAFEGCTGMTSVTCYAPIPPTGVANSAIPQSYCTLYVPASLLNTYSNSLWQFFKEIIPLPENPIVRFVDWNGRTISSAEVAVGTAATAPADPSRDGYTFIGWNKDFSNVTEDMTITALYQINQYQIVVTSNDDAFGSIEGENGTFNYKSEHTYTAVPSEGHYFVRWSDDKTDNPRTIVLTQDIALTAVFAAIQYTITWQDEDGNVIKTDQVAQGTTPAFTGTTPTKEGYTFAGWLPNIKPATKDMCYFTYFIPTQQAETPVYTVNINGENCSLNISNQYPEGAVITIEAVADDCFEFQRWSDGNKDNPRTITVTANTNLTAEFNKVRYTITDKTEPGTGGKIQIVGQ